MPKILRGSITQYFDKYLSNASNFSASYGLSFNHQIFKQKNKVADFYRSTTLFWFHVSRILGSEI